MKVQIFRSEHIILLWSPFEAWHIFNLHSNCCSDFVLFTLAAPLFIQLLSIEGMNEQRENMTDDL
jgi:hypothetical protein